MKHLLRAVAASFLVAAATVLSPQALDGSCRRCDNGPYGYACTLDFYGLPRCEVYESGGCGAWGAGYCNSEVGFLVDGAVPPEAVAQAEPESRLAAAEEPVRRNCAGMIVERRYDSETVAQLLANSAAISI